MREKQTAWMVEEDGLRIGMFTVVEPVALEPRQSPINLEHYETTTMDTGVLETLYQGASLDDAVKAALEYGGKSSVIHFRYDGTCRNVADYRNGKMLMGYVYE